MSSVPLHYVDLRAFCYATEEEQRVEQALRTYLPEDCELDRSVTEGHHGNRIVVLSVRVERADEIRHVIDTLAALDDIDTVVGELDERVDENCAFFLTLDKQAAFRGTVARGDGITFRTKVEAYPAKQATAVENARELFEAL